MRSKIKKGKDGKICSIIHIVFSLLLLAGPKSIFAVCPVGDHPMKCYWSSQALIPMALILLTVGVLFFMAESDGTKKVLSVIAIITSVMVIWIPAGLIGGCGKETMACRSLTFPAVYLIAGIVIVSAVTEIILLIRRKSGIDQQEREDEIR